MTIPELTLRGTPAERGETHGEAMRDSIAGAFEAWKESVAPSMNPDEFIGRLVNDTGFLSAAKTHTPDLVEEVQGIAVGSNQPFEAMFAWQLVDEGWWYLAELTGELKPLEKCSALTINHDGHGLVAQTQDLDRHYDHAHVMLRTFDPEGLEILTPSIAGLLALNGVNSAGLAVGITTLSPLAHSPNGLSSGFVLPRLLRCRSVEEALDVLRRTPLASGNSFILGQRDRSVIVEVSSDAVDIDTDGNRAVHTNHPLTQNPVWDYARFASSTERFDQLDKTVRTDSTLAELVEMYGSGAICQSRSIDGPIVSVGTMLFELGDTQRCHYAPGPLDSDELVTYEMTGSD